MPKLKVNGSFHVETSPTVIRDDSSGELKRISGTQLTDLFKQADLSKIGFEVVTANEDNEIVFIFDGPTRKKGAVFNIKENADASGFVADIEGPFELALRSGAASVLKSFEGTLDLRIRAITLNGGYWSGFSSFVLGGDEDADWDSYKFLLPKIDHFEIK